MPPLTIIQGGGTILRDKSDRNLLYDESNLSNYKMVNKDDFVVHLRSFEGGLEIATNTGIISPAYHTLHGENTDSRFFYSHFRSKNFINIGLAPHVYGIRDGRSIDIEGMKTIQIPYTSYEEQKMIGDFVESIDKLTLLHQRKCDELEKIFNLFLKDLVKGTIKIDNLTKKEIWEKRKMSDLIFYKEKSKLPASTGNISGKYRFFKSDSSETEYYCDTKLTSGENIIMNDGGVCAFKYFNGEVAYSDHCICFSSNESVKFLYYALLSQKDIINEKGFIGGTLKNIDREYFNNIEINIPEINTQEKIAAFLSNFENLINNEKKVIDELKKVKKTLLDKMFV